jgi:hypothetical protein
LSFLHHALTRLLLCISIFDRSGRTGFVSVVINALATIARENGVTAKAKDTSSASRSSFLFRFGWFFVIEKMMKREVKGSGLTLVSAIASV